MNTETIAIKHFKCRVTKDTAYGRVADYGVQENTMVFRTDGKHMWIDWWVGKENDEVDMAEIGIWTVGKKVVDYDGVFEIPVQALELLQKAGYDTKEIESTEEVPA